MNTKRCTICCMEKPISDFSAGYCRKDGTRTPRPHCKTCVRANSKKHYYATSHVEKRYDGSFNMSLYGRQRLIAFRAWIDSLKKKPCMDCGNTFPPVCMDFDHVRGEKVKHISSMWSWERGKVLEELAKCDLVCACCHRIRTNDRLHSRLQEVG